MKKKKDVSGLIFSAFLVIAYVVCSYFFVGIINDSAGMDATVKLLLKCLVFLLFGLVLFYATRVGEGKQIKRFSISALLLIDLPAIYLILAACFTWVPLPFDISAVPETVSIAAVALGYGIPYTFLSGFELDIPKDNKDEKKADAAEDEGEAEEEAADEDKASEDDAQIEETTAEAAEAENADADEDESVDNTGDEDESAES